MSLGTTVETRGIIVFNCMEWNPIGDYCDTQWPHYSWGWGTFYVPTTPTFTVSTFVHACHTPTLANSAPTWALCPPAPFHAPPCTFVHHLSWVFLHPLHILCPSTPTSLSHGL